jgi:hypothetical protein
LTLTRSGRETQLGDGAGYVLGLQEVELVESAYAFLCLLVHYVVGQLGLDGARLNHGHPDVVLQSSTPEASEISLTVDLVPE